MTSAGVSDVQTLVSSYGRGVWAVRFGAGSITILGRGLRPGVGERLQFKVSLSRESGAALAGVHPSLVVSAPAPFPDASPTFLILAPNAVTDSQGEIAVDEQIALRPGYYTLSVALPGDETRPALF